MGPGGVGWRPSGKAEQQANVGTSEHASESLPEPAVGVVRGFQARTEGSEIVWSFRLERYNSSGDRLTPIPVEMRDYNFQGSINDGDQVEISLQWREGEILRPTRVKNFTTRCLVGKRKLFGKFSKALGIIALIGFLLGLVGLMGMGISLGLQTARDLAPMFFTLALVGGGIFMGGMIIGSIAYVLKKESSEQSVDSFGPRKSR